MQFENSIKVTAPKHFAGFLTAMDIPFFYYQGAFYIYRHSASFTTNAQLFRSFCLTRGVRESDLPRTSITTGNFNLNLDRCAC